MKNILLIALVVLSIGTATAQTEVKPIFFSEL